MCLGPGVPGNGIILNLILDLYRDIGDVAIVEDGDSVGNDGRGGTGSHGVVIVVVVVSRRAAGRQRPGPEIRYGVAVTARRGQAVLRHVDHQLLQVRLRAKRSNCGQKGHFNSHLDNQVATAV